MIYTINNIKKINDNNIKLNIDDKIVIKKFNNKSLICKIAKYEHTPYLLTGDINKEFDLIYFKKILKNTNCYEDNDGNICSGNTHNLLLFVTEMYKILPK